MSRHHRNIEEEFRAIAPPGHRGIPPVQPIAVGIAGSGGNGFRGFRIAGVQEISKA